jgi:hypothetical protein
MRIENRLTSAQCNIIAGRIVDSFYRDAAGGTQYGVDWPTARVLWPRRCRVFDRLRQRYRELCK